MRLGAKNTFTLTTFVQSAYIQSALNDVQFASKAASELGFPVNHTHVAAARKTLGLPSNAVPGQNRNSPTSLLAERLDDLTRLFNLQQDELALIKPQIQALQRSYAQLAAHKIS